jgi:hypothetical protein
MNDDLPAALGPYEVLARLSRGGMGQVLLGRRTGAHGFERLVALKIILPEDRGADLRSMFLDEARLLAKLTHPAVAQVYDFGEDDGRLWLAMEYVAGVSLHELAQVPPAIAARLVAEACRGLHAAHELRDRDGRPLNVVHRDISPDNLRLGFDGQVKVLDFGVALVRGRQQPVTEAGFIKGKLQYMAPEQVRGDIVDRRSDVYALGVVLHEMMTGQVLLTDADALEALGNRARKIVPPSSRVQQLEQGFDAVVMKALADNPDERYATALELHEALVALAPAASLERFASETLAAKAEKHRVWLQQVLADQVPTAPKAQQAFRQTVAERTPVSTLAPTVKTPPRVRWVGLLIGALVAIGVGAGAVVLVSSSQPAALPAPTPAPVAAVEVDAGAVAPEVDLTIGEPALDHRAVAAVAKPKAPPPKPKTEPPVASPPPSGTATLQVVATDAYGVVRLDGNVVGPTPQKLKVSAGSHVVEVLRPDTNEVQLSQKLELADGDVRRVVAP